MSKPSVKIFVSSHKPTKYVEDDVFEAIQVGSALAKEKLPGFLHDDDGENISKDNLRFCELTAQYWVWENLPLTKLGYVGFFHYRRYLAFRSEQKDTPDIWGSLICPTLNSDSIEKYGLDSATIETCIDGYDIILPTKKSIKTMPSSGTNAREQYVSSGFLHEKDLKIMLEVLAEKYPGYLPYAENYLNSHYTYLNNMFIMKRALFEKYSEWLFDILFECDKRIDYDDYSIEATRTPGHLAERLLNIFVEYLKDHEECRILELPTVVFLNTAPEERILPAFKQNNVAIALSANDFYAPYLATVLTSIVANSSTMHNYDILIMHKDISVTSQKRLASTVDQPNFSLRFINVSSFEERFRPLFLRGHFTIETWFRLLMPEIMEAYEKILYLDSDLVALDDVAKLYDTNLDGNLLAACRDADTAGLYNGFEPNKRIYMDKVLKIAKPYDYFQAGVILFNLAEFRKNHDTVSMLEFASSYSWELLDQDVLNYLAQGRVKFVDMSWNVMFDWRNIRIKEIISRAPKRLCAEYMGARSCPKIIHFAGPDKPWDDPLADFAEEFWKYARMNNYYEIILKRMLASKSQQGIKNNLKKVVRRVLPSGTKRRLVIEQAYRKVLKR